MAVALDYPLWQLGLLISLYSIGMGMFQAPLGILSDRIDRRYLLPTGIVLTGAAYVVFALSPTIGAAVSPVTIFDRTFTGGYLIMAVAMVVVGFGLAVVHPVGYPMVSDNVSPDNKGKVLGIFGASSKVGDATAPSIIAVLILVLSWQPIILLFGVTGMLYGLVLYAVLRRDEFETVPRSNRDGHSEVETVANVDRDRRSFLYPITVVYFFFISSMLSTRGLNTFLPAFLVAVYGYSFTAMGVFVGAESVANIYFAILLLAGAVMQLVLGKLTDTYDTRLILLCCMGVATAGMVVLALVDLHPVLLFILIVALGAGLYGVNPARDSLISELSPPDYEGRTFGYVFTAVALTSAPLPAVIGYLLDEIGMGPGFLLLAVGPFLAGICIALLSSDRIYRTEPQTRDPVEKSG